MKNTGWAPPGKFSAGALVIDCHALDVVKCSEQPMLRSKSLVSWPQNLEGFAPMQSWFNLVFFWLTTLQPMELELGVFLCKLVCRADLWMIICLFRHRVWSTLELGASAPSLPHFLTVITTMYMRSTCVDRHSAEAILSSKWISCFFLQESVVGAIGWNSYQ